MAGLVISPVFLAIFRNLFVPASRPDGGLWAPCPRETRAAPEMFPLTIENFDGFGLAEPLARALRTAGFSTPTPIQAGAIPPAMAGRDLLGIAQTGTGKTLAFALPTLQHLLGERRRAAAFATRALILSPTRELAVQIDETFRRLAAGTPLSTALILGGVGRGGQVRRMARGVDLVIGTPGRVCDLMSTGELRLGGVSHFVLDEADRMLDLGFIRDIRRVIAALPAARQSMLFSATMPIEVGGLAESLLREPVRVEVAAAAPTPLAITQQVHHVRAGGKRALLADMLRDVEMRRVIVFTRTKRAADRLAEELEAEGFAAECMHGNMSQNARQRALEGFRGGRARVLVATDLAARGLDVAGVTHVVNYDLPNEPESYVHRIGRTARAGASGVAIAFCDASERGFLRAIERLTGVRLAIVGGADWLAASAEEKPRAPGGRGAPHGGRTQREGSGRQGSGRQSSGRQGSGGRRAA